MPAAQHIGCVRTASTSTSAPYMARRRIKVKEILVSMLCNVTGVTKLRGNLPSRAYWTEENSSPICWTANISEYSNCLICIYSSLWCRNVSFSHAISRGVSWNLPCDCTTLSFTRVDRLTSAYVFRLATEFMLRMNVTCLDKEWATSEFSLSLVYRFQYFGLNPS